MVDLQAHFATLQEFEQQQLDDQVEHIQQLQARETQMEPGTCIEQMHPA
jgi:hypothetical protein